jgi:hypothetical protein
MIAPPAEIAPERRGELEILPRARPWFYLSTLPVHYEAFQLAEHALHVRSAAADNLRDEDEFSQEARQLSGLDPQSPFIRLERQPALDISGKPISSLASDGDPAQAFDITQQ